MDETTLAMIITLLTIVAGTLVFAAIISISLEVTRIRKELVRLRKLAEGELTETR